MAAHAARVSRSACSRSCSGVILRPVSPGPSGTPRIVARATEVFRFAESPCARCASRPLGLWSPCRFWRSWCFISSCSGIKSATGGLFHPAVAVRWGLSALLLAVLAGLRRAGVPLFWGRRALVMWVLVALLHWTAMPAGDLDDVTQRGGQAALVLVDLSVSGAAGLLLAASLLLLLLLGARAAAECRARDARAPVRGRRCPCRNPRPPSRLARTPSRVRLIARGRHVSGRSCTSACGLRRRTRTCDARGAVRDTDAAGMPARAPPRTR